METDKTKTEVKESYQNVYEQYYHYNSEWHNWQRYIKDVISGNSTNCEYIKSQQSELEKYMLESLLGRKWYEHDCPNLMKNEPITTGFLFWWRKRYEGKLQPVDDTTSKVDECNTFFFNYSKWQYLKSLFKEPEPQQKSNEKTTVDLNSPSELNTKKPALTTKGRKKITFKDCIVKEKKEEILSCLKNVLSGEKGKYVALIIRTCIKEGLIKKPTFSCVENEFGEIGYRSGYNKYMDEKYEFTGDEEKGATKTLESILQ